MSILGYSASYFLPEYWSNTPLYGEKIVPLLDYILSSDFAQADKLANAFYMMENKYKNTANLPKSAIEAIIDESGYGYVKGLLADDEDSLRLLVYLLVLIHQLKGTKLGIEVVLNLLRRDNKGMTQNVVGNPTISPAKDVTDFSLKDYIMYTGFTVGEDPFELNFQIRTSANFSSVQTIASCGMYGFYLGINNNGQLVLNLGSKARVSWDIVNSALSYITLAPSTNYYLKLTYDGYEYDVKVSLDGVKYNDYITVSKSTPLDINSGAIYIGVDNSTGELKNPYGGFINLAPFSLDVQNINITEWFEKFPVGDEDTFGIKADLDLGVVNTDFFQNFAVFVSKYVYPTLEAFEAKLNFESNLTFLPYVRQRITYVAEGDMRITDKYLVKTTVESPVATDPFRVITRVGNRIDFEVVPE